MSLKLTRQADVAVIRLLGDIDMEEAVAIKNRIAELIEKECCRLVLDLESVQHVNAAGWGFLDGSVRRLRARQGDLRLSNPNMAIRHTLDMLGMAKVLRIYDSREAAVQSFEPLSLAA